MEPKRKAKKYSSSNKVVSEVPGTPIFTLARHVLGAAAAAGAKALHLVHLVLSRSTSPLLPALVHINLSPHPPEAQHCFLASILSADRCYLILPTTLDRDPPSSGLVHLADSFTTPFHHQSSYDLHRAFSHASIRCLSVH